MPRPFMIALAPAFALLAACSGKTDSAATPAVDSTAVAPAAVIDSGAAAAADSLAKQSADSAAKKAMSAPVAKKVETGDYDKAIRPKFKIDEKTGKVDTIKRP
jgi:hypothetical protein